MTSYTPTPRTTLHRRAHRGSYDRATVHAILDEALVAHVGFAVEGNQMVLPMTFVRIDERVYLHGAPSNHMLKALAGGAPLCLTVTLLDALVFSRAASHHSMNYRCVVALGQAREVRDLAEKKRVFDALVDRMAPGRSQQARPATEAEMVATRLVVLDLEEVSAKIRTGAPFDEEPDQSWPCWSGLIPLALEAKAPVPVEGLAPGHEPPGARK
jgi:hypothetical protein